MTSNTSLLRAAGFAALLASSTVQAQTPVTIGVMSDMSSVYSDIGGKGSVEAVRMAIEDFKAEAKGLKVNIVSADPQNKPDIAATLARKWYDVDGVDMVIDLPTSAVSMAVGQIAQEKNKVALYSASASSDMTGKACTPNTIHWTYDTWALSHGTGEAVVKAGGKSWFFLTADYAFGQALERDTAQVVKANGGTVVGSVSHPLATADFSSFILQAQASKAQVIGLANGGADTTSAIKTASEFGLVQGGQKLAGMLLFISDIHSLGLKTAQGLMLTTAFYWDLNDRTRAFAKRFAARNEGRYPTMSQAGTYSSTLAYLAAVKKLGSPDDGRAIIKAIRDASPIDDPLFGKTTVRIDGRAIHDMYLVEVKKPSESTKPYDYYKVVATIPAERAFRPLADGGCPLVTK
ncbi:ABC transporter substrate-binding protein [Quisquiliibacterium transsilvanicum]|uniref:Branched-chain amino acid transport system substrate-binding protein n=1 Tax=Quisquiliibacterium transsilvanicum TaxID=1549638 RepID=A0A7W8HEL0_9BURK|nr:ABC transporter substrate-binding protein [Quisquiliibacterium transsilvanicum]MBB5270483.1 branched-chain amino acid transport system substrate-binding protein [Quisquiliibacterium transsilvanicum]